MAEPFFILIFDMPCYNPAMKRSLAHLPKQKQTELMLITKKICDVVPQAEIIFLFGSYARGDWVDGPHIQGRGRLTIRKKSRDFIYVSDLIRSYFTDDKVIDTLQLCEQNGINTITAVATPRAIRVFKKYWNQVGGKIQWIAQVTLDDTEIKKAIDSGVIGAYIGGNHGDQCSRDGTMDLIEKRVSLIKQNELIAGVAGHEIRVPIALEAAGIDADFYLKTLHNTEYWSSQRADHDRDVIDNLKLGVDNYWCRDYGQTIEFMQTVKKPWVAYKVLAAGAVHPSDGFEYAYKNGADFVLAGMFDFQLAEDAAIAKECIAKNLQRRRLWAG